MAYSLGDIYEPWQEDEETGECLNEGDMWAAQIDYHKQDEKDPMIKHAGCVEAYGDTRATVMRRAIVIVIALNRDLHGVS